jgi:hypothetical protein
VQNYASECEECRAETEQVGGMEEAGRECVERSRFRSGRGTDEGF